MALDFSEESLLYMDLASEALREQLQQVGRRQIAALARATRSHNPSVGKAAIELILLLPEPSRFDTLRHALGSRSPVVGGYAVEALEVYGERAVPALLEHLNDSHILVKMWMVVALGKIGSRLAVPLLLERLEAETTPSLCYTIIQALGEIGDPAALPSIQKRIDDDDHHVRLHAQLALQRLSGRRSSHL